MRKTLKAKVQALAETGPNQPIIATEIEKQPEAVPELPAAAAQPKITSIAATAVAAIQGADVEVVGDDWGPVDLSFMNPAMGAAPTLPLDQLPNAFAELVAQFSEARCLVPDFVAFSVLGAVSGAIGNRIRVRLYDGTMEPMALYVALIGEPSTGKGQAIKLVEAPLTFLDEELSGPINNAAVATGRAALDRVSAQIQARVAGRLTVGYETPVAHSREQSARSLLLTETTGAGLLEELSGDGAGRMLLAHELAGSLAFLGAGQPLRARSLLLNAYDGNSIIVRSKSGGKIRLAALLLTILGATQPARLPSLLRQADDGFAARFFWIYPNITPVAQMGVGLGPVDALAALLSSLFNTASAGEMNDPIAIPLAAEARAPLEAASRAWAQQQLLSDELLSGVLGRGRQYAIRLAGLLQLIDHVMTGKLSLPDTIGVEAVGSAIALVDRYILPMAERVLTLARPGQSDAVALAKFLARRGNSVINSRSDIVRGESSPLRDSMRVREAIEELAQRGLLRPEQRSGGRGRPSGDWHVHPELLALRKW